MSGQFSRNYYMFIRNEHAAIFEKKKTHFVHQGIGTMNENLF